MHIIQNVKKIWCFCIYADIFVNEFCLVTTKQHPTVYKIITGLTVLLRRSMGREIRSDKIIITYAGL